MTEYRQYEKSNISVILITRNRAEILCQALNALKVQTVAPVEIIVVDTSDTEATAEILAANYPEVIHVYHPMGPRNMAWSRNQGIRAGQALIVAFLDDDSIAEPQWAAEIVRAYGNDSTIGGAGGRIIEGLETPLSIPLGQKVATIDRYGRPQANFNALTDGIVEVDHFKGCNMSFRRDVLALTGNFDEAFNGSVRDETDVCVRLRQAGYRLVYNPDATVEHKGFTLFAHKRVQLESVGSGYPVARLDGYYVAKNFGIGAWAHWYTWSNIRAFCRAFKVNYMAFARAFLGLGGGVTGLVQAVRRKPRVIGNDAPANMARSIAPEVLEKGT